MHQSAGLAQVSPHYPVLMLLEVQWVVGHVGERDWANTSSCTVTIKDTAIHQDMCVLFNCSSVDEVQLEIDCAHIGIDNITNAPIINTSVLEFRTFVVTSYDTHSETCFKMSPISVTLQQKYDFVESIIMPLVQSDEEEKMAEKPTRKEWLKMILEKAISKEWDEKDATELCDRLGHIVTIEMAQEKLSLINDQLKMKITQQGMCNIVTAETQTE